MLTMPVHQRNLLYDTKYRMFMLGGWFRNDAAKRAQRLLTDGRYLQLDANLRFFYRRYAKILEARDAKIGAGFEIAGDLAVYYDYIERSRDEVEVVGGRLAELDAVREKLLSEAYEKWKKWH
jgi:hypothetical protein